MTTAEAEWGKRRPGNYFDQRSDHCGDREPHPRHDWRGFAGGHNTEILWCLGTAPRCTCNASGNFLKGNGPDPARCPVHGDAA